MKKPFMLSMMLGFFLLSLFPSPSKALSCAELEGPAIDYYDAAIVGTVLNIKDDLVQKGFTGPKDIKRYVLIEVERSWKIAFPSQTIFETDFTWGHSFEKGKKYLVYLNEANESYTNSPCSPVSLVHASSDYEELGEGFVPTEKVQLGYKMWLMFDQDLDLVFVGVLMLIVFIISWTWYKKRRERL